VHQTASRDAGRLSVRKTLFVQRTEPHAGKEMLRTSREQWVTHKINNPKFSDPSSFLSLLLLVRRVIAHYALTESSLRGNAPRPLLWYVSVRAVWESLLTCEARTQSAKRSHQGAGRAAVKQTKGKHLASAWVSPKAIKRVNCQQ
jgi:hypothetical protein